MCDIKIELFKVTLTLKYLKNSDNTLGAEHHLRPEKKTFPSQLNSNIVRLISCFGAEHEITKTKSLSE